MSTERKKQKIQRRRGTSMALRLVRFQFLLLQYLYPALAVRKAYELWFVTRRFTPPAREHRWAKGAKQQRIDSSVGSIQTYHWGSTGPLILLVHGWNGRGLQMGAFVEALLERGYQVVTLDLPGHGHSEGNSSNVFRMSQSLLELQQHFVAPHAIIAHSFGATVAGYALNHGLNADRFVSISAPLNIDWLIERFSTAIRLTPSITARLRRQFEFEFGNDVFAQASTDYNFAQLSLPAMVIHDRDDTDVPWRHATTLAENLKGSSLYFTDKLGHRRILYNRNIIERVVDFIAVNNQQVKTATWK